MRARDRGPERQPESVVDLADLVALPAGPIVYCTAMQRRAVSDDLIARLVDGLSTVSEF